LVFGVFFGFFFFWFFVFFWGGGGGGGGLVFFFFFFFFFFYLFFFFTLSRALSSLFPFLQHSSIQTSGLKVAAGRSPERASSALSLFFSLLSLLFLHTFDGVLVILSFYPHRRQRRRRSGSVASLPFPFFSFLFSRFQSQSEWM